MPALPIPIIAAGMRNAQTGVSMFMSAAYTTRAPVTVSRPGTRRTRGSTRSSRRPANGESTPANTAVGTSSRAACVGESPRASWMKNISGSDMLVTVNPTMATPVLASAKLRSPNSPSGTRGSPRVSFCCQRNSPSTTTPAPIIPHTHGAQSYASPSCSPKTMRNSAAALRTTPTTSKRCGCLPRSGTSIHARTNPTMPTGMLMKKIHSHPRPSTRKPPAKGPTSIATPDVPPHRPIAAPR